MARFRGTSCLWNGCGIGARSSIPAKHAPVAQLDRALDYESRGQEFESLRARHSVLIGNQTKRPWLPYFDSLRTSIMRDVAITVISK